AGRGRSRTGRPTGPPPHASGSVELLAQERRHVEDLLLRRALLELGAEALAVGEPGAGRGLLRLAEEGDVVGLDRHLDLALRARRGDVAVHRRRRLAGVDLRHPGAAGVLRLLLAALLDLTHPVAVEAGRDDRDLDLFLDVLVDD